jgi:hypothetical protein
MSEITLEGISQVIREELKPVKETLAEHTRVLESHTTALDGLAKDVKTLLGDRAVTTHRIESVEKVVKELAIKAGLKLDW